MTDWLVNTFLHETQGGQPAPREKYGLLAGCIGIFLNLLLSGGKFLAGAFTGSIAIMADAFNNLSDAGSSVVTLVGFHMAGRDADEGHPFGHGRMEYVSGLVVSMVIILVGFELGKSSLGKILAPTPLSFSWLSVGILAVSIAVKLWMCHFNRALGHRISSAAMAATAADSLSDVVATSAVLLGTLVSHFFALQIDGWVGLLVAVFVIKAGWDAAQDTLNPLLGQCPDPALVHAVREEVLANPEITGLHDLVVHDYGPGRVMLSLHAEVAEDGNISVLHDVIDNTERALKEKFHVEAVIHMDPIATHDAHTNAIKAEMAAFVATLAPGMTLHDFRMTAGTDHTNLIFDVALPLNCPLTDEAVRAAIAHAADEMEGTFYTVVSIDRSYTAIV